MKTVDDLYGTLPDVKRQPMFVAAAAEEALEQVLLKNQTEGKLVAGIKPEDAKILMDWIAQSARQGLLDWDRGMDSKAAKSFLERRRKQKEEGKITSVGGYPYTCPADFLFKSEYIFGECIHAAAIVSRQAQKLGITAYDHHTNGLLNTEKLKHAFSVVALPVQNADDSIEEKRFLVDVTFRQFFHPKLSQEAKEWAANLLQKKGGVELAETLLKKGYIELNAETAKLYLGSHPAAKNIEWLQDNPLAVFFGRSSKHPLAITVSSMHDRTLVEMEEEGKVNTDTPKMKMELPKAHINKPVLGGKIYTEEDIKRLFLNNQMP